MGNLIDIIGNTGKITNSRYHFRTDALTDLTIHCRLMAKFIDRQSSLFRFGLDINVVVVTLKHKLATQKIFLYFPCSIRLSLPSLIKASIHLFAVLPFSPNSKTVAS